jgi:hypothetical protein
MTGRILATLKAYAYGSDTYEVFATEFVGETRRVYTEARKEARFQRRQSGKVVVTFYSVKPGTFQVPLNVIGVINY